MNLKTLCRFMIHFSARNSKKNKRIKKKIRQQSCDLIINQALHLLTGGYYKVMIRIIVVMIKIYSIYNHYNIISSKIIGIISSKFLDYNFYFFILYNKEILDLFIVLSKLEFSISTTLP